MTRSLEMLRPEMQARVQTLLALCARDKVNLLIYCTLRSAREQAELYAIGRTIEDLGNAQEAMLALGRPDMAALLGDVVPQVGRRVTMAMPGQSAHNYGLAIDAVPMVNGKPMWVQAHPAWHDYGRLVREAGLEWAGDWMRFREYPHAQMPGFNWRERIRHATA